MQVPYVDERDINGMSSVLRCHLRRDWPPFGLCDPPVVEHAKHGAVRSITKQKLQVIDTLSNSAITMS